MNRMSPTQYRTATFKLFETPENAVTNKNTGEDYVALYVEGVPGRYSQLRADLYAAGIDTKKVINISYVNSRTAEFVVLRTYAKLFFFENFDSSKPCDPTASADVQLAFSKSFDLRTKQIIESSRNRLVREFYENLRLDKGFHPRFAENEGEVPCQNQIEEQVAEGQTCGVESFGLNELIGNASTSFDVGEALATSSTQSSQLAKSTTMVHYEAEYQDDSTLGLPTEMESEDMSFTDEERMSSEL
jgi:hypothetical protein